MGIARSAEDLEFHALGGRGVMGRFVGGRISSDEDGLLLREVDTGLECCIDSSAALPGFTGKGGEEIQGNHKLQPRSASGTQSHDHAAVGADVVPIHIEPQPHRVDRLEAPLHQVIQFV